MDKFADILADLIKEKGLSLRKIASLSNVSATQYGKYLKGAYPTIEVAVRISDFFCCSLDYLFGINDNNVYSNTNYDLSKFIPRYLKLLKENDITHWKFAKENDLSESCLRHWKYGETPKIESLIKIATSLSSSIDYLIGRR